MPRKLPRTPRKTPAADTQAETNCTCECKSPTDAGGNKSQPDIDMASLDHAIYQNIGEPTP